jgi:Bacterial membrane protein YfhO
MAKRKRPGPPAENPRREDPGEGRAVAVSVAVVALAAAVVFRDYLRFERLYLFKDIGADTLNIFYPQLHHLSEYLRRYGSPGWSFAQGMGQNLSAFSLGNPFDDILYICGRGLAYAIGWVECLKVVTAGLFFALFLRARGSVPFVVVAGALLYAFCGFTIVGSGWYIFSTDAVYAALLLYALERFWQGRGFWPLSVAVALTGANQPFDLYLFALMALAYLALRLVEEGGWSPRRTLAMALRMGAAGGIGVGLSAVFLGSNVLLLLQSPRVGGHSSYAAGLSSAPIGAIADGAQLATALLRLFSSNLLGVGSQFQGAMNYLEAPVFYCGLLTLLLVPQAFALAERRMKIAYAGLLGVLLLNVFFPWLRHALYLFTGDYYRVLSLFVALGLLYPALDALGRLVQGARPRGWLLTATVVVLLVLLYLPLGLPVDPGLQLRGAVFLVLQAAALQGLGRPPLRKAALGVLLLFLFLDVTMTGSDTVTLRDAVSASEWAGRRGYNDETMDALALIKAQDPGFYRIEKSYHSSPATFPSLNDAKVQDYFGTTSYHSFNQKYYVQFLEEMGIVTPGHEQDSRWANGLANTPVLLTWASVKYYLSRAATPSSFLQRSYEVMARVGEVSVYRNRYFLPLGFCYDRWISAEAFRKLSLPQKQLALLQAYVSEQPPSALAPYVPEESPPFERYVAGATARARDTLALETFTPNHLAGRITLDRPELLFFSIPYDGGWKASVDGRDAEIERVTFGFIGLHLAAGAHAVELAFHPPLLRAGLVVSLLFAGLLVGLVRSPPVTRWMALRPPA